jgi:hypothetical protein
MLHKSCLLVCVGVAVLLLQPSIARAQAVGPDLVIAVSHTGNFTVGVNGVYTIVVSNIGDGIGGGPIAGMVYDQEPTGFTYVSMTGDDWSCDQPSPNNLKCSPIGLIDPLLPPGQSYPPITLTVIPTVSGTVTNTACVGVSCSSDPTIIVAAVPTFPEWAMIGLAALLALAGVTAVRRRTT